MTKNTLSTLLALILLSAGARAQEEKIEKPRKVTPLKLQVVFSRDQGAKKVSSVPYTLSLNANDRPARVRMGINVPLHNEGKETPGAVVYQNVGNKLDCSAEALDDGRFKVACSLEQSSLYSMDAERNAAGLAGETSPGPPVPPIFRTFTSEAILILRDGQTAQYIAATDPVNGEVLKVDVTLNVVK